MAGEGGRGAGGSQRQRVRREDAERVKGGSFNRNTIIIIINKKPLKVLSSVCSSPVEGMFFAVSGLLLIFLLLPHSVLVPMRFTPGWHSGDAGVCLWAVHGATELRVFTVVAFCAAWNGGGVL